MPASILIVDDEKEIRKSSSELLEYEGYEVETSADGSEALVKVENNKYKLAFIDLVLPGPYNGLDIINKIRETSKDTHIIAFTGFGGQSLRQKAFKAGANEFMSKPILANKLLRKVYEILGESNKAAPKPEKEGEQKGIKFASIFFKDMNETDIDMIMSQAKTHHLAPDAYYKVDGAKEIVIVKSGQVECFYGNISVGNLRQGDVIGETSCFAQDSNSYSFYLRSSFSVELLLIDKVKLRNIFNQRKDLFVRYINNTVVTMSQKYMAACQKLVQLHERKVVNVDTNI